MSRQRTKHRLRSSSVGSLGHHSEQTGHCPTSRWVLDHDGNESDSGLDSAGDCSASDLRRTSRSNRFNRSHKSPPGKRGRSSSLDESSEWGRPQHLVDSLKWEFLGLQPPTYPEEAGSRLSANSVGSGELSTSSAFSTDLDEPVAQSRSIEHQPKRSSTEVLLAMQHDLEQKLNECSSARLLKTHGPLRKRNLHQKPATYPAPAPADDDVGAGPAVESNSRTPNRKPSKVEKSVNARPSTPVLQKNKTTPFWSIEVPACPTAEPTVVTVNHDELLTFNYDPGSPKFKAASSSLSLNKATRRTILLEPPPEFADIFMGVPPPPPSALDQNSAFPEETSRPKSYLDAVGQRQELDFNASHALTPNLQAVCEEELGNMDCVSMDNSELDIEQVALEALAEGWSVFKVVVNVQFGLGFQIYTEDEVRDDGVFFGEIDPRGPIGTDGTIRSGDRILSVNGIDVSLGGHDRVTNLLLEVTSELVIVVARRADGGRSEYKCGGLSYTPINTSEIRCLWDNKTNRSNIGTIEETKTVDLEVDNHTPTKKYLAEKPISTTSAPLLSPEEMAAFTEVLGKIADKTELSSRSGSPDKMGWFFGRDVTSVKQKQAVVARSRSQSMRGRKNDAPKLKRNSLFRQRSSSVNSH